MTMLASLVVLPLLAILAQQRLEVSGAIGNSLYKIALLVPPLIYCHVHKISIAREILKLRHWRNGLSTGVGLGVLAVAIFWGLYYALGDQLLDKDDIVAKIGTQFSVTAGNVFLIAPFTIILNSLLEEFFYRGFAFGLLVRKNARVGYLLPAAVFTVQHVLFIYHWMSVVPFVIAVAGLFVLALVLERIYVRTDTIVAPWLIHVFGDIAMMGIAVTLLYGR